MATEAAEELDMQEAFSAMEEAVQAVTRHRHGEQAATTGIRHADAPVLQTEVTASMPGSAQMMRQAVTSDIVDQVDAAQVQQTKVASMPGAAQIRQAVSSDMVDQVDTKQVLQTEVGSVQGSSQVQQVVTSGQGVMTMAGPGLQAVADELAKILAPGRASVAAAFLTMAPEDMRLHCLNLPQAPPCFRQASDPRRNYSWALGGFNLLQSTFFANAISPEQICMGTLAGITQLFTFSALPVVILYFV